MEILPLIIATLIVTAVQFLVFGLIIYFAECILFQTHHPKIYHVLFWFCLLLTMGAYISNRQEVLRILYGN